MKESGCQYFRLTSSGNLIGEYANPQGAWPETAVRTGPGGELSSFEGSYKVSWTEEDKVPGGILKIRRDPDRRIFELIWLQYGKPVYTGVGILCDGLLIANYEQS